MKKIRDLIDSYFTIPIIKVVKSSDNHLLADLALYAASLLAVYVIFKN